MNNTNITEIKQATFNGEVDNGNSGTSKTIDWTSGNNQKVTLTGACTFTFTAPSDTARIQLRIISDGTAGRTMVFPATCRWSGGIAPVKTSAASSVDLVTFYFDGTNYWGSFISDLKASA